MKQSLLYSFLFLFALQVKAQELSISPNPIDSVISTDLSELYADLVLHAEVFNNTNETIEFRWERKVISMPDAWITRICDNNTCYNGPVYSNVASDLELDAPVVLEPGESSIMDVHFVPSGIAGSGTVQLEIAFADNPDEIIAVGEYNIEVNDMTTSTQEIVRKPIVLYPNPSFNELNISNNEIVERVVVYNMVGRVVKTFDFTLGTTYDISSLSNGIYLVGLFDQKGEVIKTIRLSKRSTTP